jgi:hypothetical protein
MRLTSKIVLCLFLIFVGYLAGAGFIWPGWPAVDNARATATAQVGDTASAVAAIATQEIQTIIDSNDYGNWKSPLDGMVRDATAIAPEITRVSGQARDLGIQAALLTPTPVATQADIAGAGATFVPTVSSGKVEIVNWAGPFADGSSTWVPVLIVNGSSRTVVVDEVVLTVQGRFVASGQFFAPALLLPGERTIGTLLGSVSPSREITAADFSITTKPPGPNDAKVGIAFDGEPTIVGGTQLVFRVTPSGDSGRSVQVAKGICFDNAGTITGMFWIDLRRGVVNRSQGKEITGNLIGPGPCESPIIGLAT